MHRPQGPGYCRLLAKSGLEEEKCLSQAELTQEHCRGVLHK